MKAENRIGLFGNKMHEEYTHAFWLKVGMLLQLRYRVCIYIFTLYQPMTHICIMSSHKNLYGGLILGVNTFSASLSCFLWSVKG